MFDYRPVKYAHVQVEPGYSLLLTADPWSFLKANLLQRKAGSRGKNASNLGRAIYYADLAEDFYAAAETADLPTEGVLRYYGMLNLVKCFISSEGVELEVDWEHHGLTLPLGDSNEVQLATPSSSGVNIFSEFAKALGTPISGKSTITFEEVCSHIPELHEVAFSLGHLPNVGFPILRPLGSRGSSLLSSHEEIPIQRDPDDRCPSPTGDR